jgi:acetylornithine/N-succinyldiaminopimelate aminotransferase
MPATPEFLAAARDLCTKRGALLIFDEVQTGIGRLGKLFAWQHYGVVPDVVSLAKALANGLPLGAILIRGAAATALRPGDHGTTFGGSPVPAAAALEHLAVREETRLDEHVAAVSSAMMSELRAIAAEHPNVFDAPRGIGLMLGLPVREPFKAGDFVPAGLNHGVILNGAGRNTLRFVPPLIITLEEAHDAMVRLRATLADVLAAARP